MSHVGMRFDWYQASIPVPTDDLVECLTDRIEHESIERAHGQHGYAQTLKLISPLGDVAASIWVPDGHVHTKPNAWASSWRTDAFVQVLRECFPVHRVSRMDPCYDVDQFGAFDRLVKAALEMADARRLKVKHVGDWHRGLDGRTLYVGSANSPVRLRIYEKGIELAQKEPHLAEIYSRDLVRVELQVRPQRAAKSEAASCSPDAAWGYASWSQALAQQLAQIDIPRVQQVVWRASDDERSYRWCLRQYGAMFLRLAQQHGSWDAFARTLWDDCIAARKDKQ